MNKPELIFVSGCNAAGKSTSLSKDRLGKENYNIIVANVDFRTTEVNHQRPGRNFKL